MERSLKVGHALKDWSDEGPSKKDSLQKVAFAMKTNLERRQELEELFFQVSDPMHSNYGNYISREQLMHYIAASDESLATVTVWLQNNGAQDVHVSDNKDMIHATLSIVQLESLLQTKFHIFANEQFKLRIARIVEPYSLPEDIAAVVALVDNIAVFPSLRTLQFNNLGEATWDNYCPGGKSCAGKITPNITAQLYKTASLTADFKVAAGNGVAVAEFQGQKYTEKDLETFSTGCNIPLLDVIDVTGKAKGFLSSGVETMLDLEYIGGNGLKIPLSNYYSYQYSLLDFATSINAQTKDAPLVYSVSYGNDEKQQVSTDFMDQVNTAFMGSGAMGFSVLFASGDQGVWGRSGESDGVFNPDFPGASPYITTVGGTDFDNRAPSLADYTEQCATDGGGGFSNTFAAPAYQTDAVKGFITAATAAGTLPPQKYFNSTGRAYPDLSANFGAVVPYCVLANRIWEGVGGTSASCPVVAHGIAILNNIQLTDGKKPLGFLNPWIYQTLAAHKDAFVDITKGKNNAGSGEGFTATAGWDACSGAGTPDFARLAQYLP